MRPRVHKNPAGTPRGNQTRLTENGNAVFENPLVRRSDGRVFRFDVRIDNRPKRTDS